MGQTDATSADAGATAGSLVPSSGASDSSGIPRRPSSVGAGGGLFEQYKQDQGKVVRVGTFIGAGLIIAWGAKFLYDRLGVFEGEETWQLLVTSGIPILFAVVLGSVCWWIVFGHRATGDFMIATEGEMKKVSWSSKREIVGSTKVVILFVVLLAVLLFVVDLSFQVLFRWIGVLKTT